MNKLTDAEIIDVGQLFWEHYDVRIPNDVLFEYAANFPQATINNIQEWGTNDTMSRSDACAAICLQMIGEQPPCPNTVEQLVEFSRKIVHEANKRGWEVYDPE